tara:strand:+ start:313 stop:534 length:222 start_codon:yes stop_codon:yes gene_type:complete
MFEIAIGMTLGCFISLVSVYLTINHKIKNEKSIKQALEGLTDGDYRIEVKNGHNYASADLTLIKKAPPNARRR